MISPLHVLTMFRALPPQSLIETNKEQARGILVANPQLTKGLFQVRQSQG